MAETQIKTMGRKQLEILDFFLTNPLCSLKEASEALGYTQSWLSIVVNSDAYKAEFERRRALSDHMIANDITARMRATAQIGLARTEQLLAVEPNLEKVSEATDKLLKSLGYTPQPSKQVATVKTTEMLRIPKPALDAARELIGTSKKDDVLVLRHQETTFTEEKDITDVFPSAAD